MLHKYTDAEIAKAESDFDESVQSTWPTTKWNGDVEIYGGRLATEEDSPFCDRTRLSLPAICSLSLSIWPYPPRARWDSQRIYFDLYTQACKC